MKCNCIHTTVRILYWRVVCILCWNMHYIITSMVLISLILFGWVADAFIYIGLGLMERFLLFVFAFQLVFVYFHLVRQRRSKDSCQQQGGESQEELHIHIIYIYMSLHTNWSRLERDYLVNVNAVRLLPNNVVVQRVHTKWNGYPNWSARVYRERRLFLKHCWFDLRYSNLFLSTTIIYANYLSTASYPQSFSSRNSCWYRHDLKSRDLFAA